jgi:hypothetical protein
MDQEQMMMEEEHEQQEELRDLPEQEDLDDQEQ